MNDNDKAPVYLLNIDYETRVGKETVKMSVLHMFSTKEDAMEEIRSIDEMEKPPKNVQDRVKFTLIEEHVIFEKVVEFK